MEIIASDSTLKRAFLPCKSSGVFSLGVQQTDSIRIVQAENSVAVTKLALLLWW